MLPDDGLRVVQQDARALEIQGHGDDVVPARAGEQPPKTDDGAAETLPVAPGYRHGRQAVSEAAVYTLARLAEGTGLPIIERDAELLSERQEI